MQGVLELNTYPVLLPIASMNNHVILNLRHEAPSATNYLRCRKLQLTDGPSKANQETALLMGPGESKVSDAS
jgi:hypothetical protein